MSLKKYRAKRNLKKSPESPAKIRKTRKGSLAFVVQKHAASRLHYDFRLEVEGVLKSWAIPKGPTLDPQVKRLAIMVEDHPYDYRNFEGIIPTGYGAGTVIIWDQGTYHVDGESPRRSEVLMVEGLKKGGVHFTLEGTKLKGRFSLIKLKNKDDEWLLIKAQDAFTENADITKLDRSVVSNKTLEEIVQTSKGIKSKKPHGHLPMQAKFHKQPFDSTEWLFEIDLGGIRALAELNANKVKLYTQAKLLNKKYPEIVESLKELNIDAIMDGEIVKDENQTSVFYVFDILYFNGRSLISLPLLKRKEILKSIIKKTAHAIYLDHIEDKGKKFFQICKKQGFNGILAKKKQSNYHCGKKSSEWLKIRC